jgi:hypothetical protein
MDNYEVKAESVTPDFKIEADYILDGQLLLLPIRGSGKCTINLGKSKIYFHGIMDRQNDKNLSGYWNTRKFKICL